MKQINFILFTALFMISGWNSQGQTAFNLNRGMQYQPVFKETTFTSFGGNTFDNRTGSLQDASITGDMFAGNCDATIVIRKPQGAIVCVLAGQKTVTELVTRGKTVYGPWSEGVWGEGECQVFIAQREERKCTRTDVYQNKHICIYMPAPAWIGWVGTATITHLHGGPFGKVENWIEERFTYGWGDWGHILSTIRELSNAVATVSSGKEIIVNYTAKKATVVVGSPFRVTEDQNLPSQIASIKYNIDGLEVTTGESVLMNNIGEHTAIAEINTKSGGVVKFNIPFGVIKPVTVEEITQQTLSNEEIQFNIKIVNNNKVHSSLAWVSSSMLNKEGYAVDIQGPKQYNLAAGSSALINIVLRPTDIRYVDPAKPETPVSSDFIVSCPTPNGLIIDRKTVVARPDAITTASGIVGTGGPQKVNTISVKTINGEVVDVKVPNNIRPGDNITGSLTSKSQSSTLQGAVVDVQDKKSNVRDKLFKFLVPAGLASIPLIIRDNNGTELARTEIPINAPNLPTPGNNVTVPLQQIELPPPRSPGSFAPMNYCQPGEPLTINGFFDGDAANTTISINNIPCEIIAESNWGSYAQVPPNLPAGHASLTIHEGEVTQTLPIQVITTNLTSNKTVVEKNTKATVTATVGGLENLDLNKNNFKIELTNGSPGVIQFRDANTTTISRDINSSNVKNGTFTFTTDIIGTSTGSYTISSNVTSTTCTDCWKQYENCIAQVEAEEKQCYKDCDKNNGGVSCYLACSAAARLKEAECFAQYLGCIRKKLGF